MDNLNLIQLLPDQGPGPRSERRPLPRGGPGLPLLLTKGPNEIEVEAWRSQQNPGRKSLANVAQRKRTGLSGGEHLPSGSLDKHGGQTIGLAMDRHAPTPVHILPGGRVVRQVTRCPWAVHRGIPNGRTEPCISPGKKTGSGKCPWAERRHVPGMFRKGEKDQNWKNEPPGKRFVASDLVPSGGDYPGGQNPEALWS